MVGQRSRGHLWSDAVKEEAGERMCLEHVLMRELHTDSPHPEQCREQRLDRADLDSMLCFRKLVFPNFRSFPNGTRVCRLRLRLRTSLPATLPNGRLFINNDSSAAVRPVQPIS